MKNDVDLQLDFNVKNVLSPTEEELKLKTTKPVHNERGDVVLLDCGKVDENG